MIRAGRDGREHELERGEQHEGDGHCVDRGRFHPDVVEEDVVQIADEAHTVDIRAERQREADDDPHDADKGQAEEAVHDGGQHVLAADEAAVEERQARQHDHDQRRGHQHPGGIATIHLCSSRSVQGHMGRGATLRTEWVPVRTPGQGEKVAVRCRVRPSGGRTLRFGCTSAAARRSVSAICRSARARPPAGSAASGSPASSTGGRRRSSSTAR